MNFISIGRFGKIIDGAAFYRFHRGCNIAVAGQHDDARIRIFGSQIFYHIKPIAVFQSHINHCIGRLDRFAELDAFADRSCAMHHIAATFHGTAKAIEPWLVVVNNQ